MKGMSEALIATVTARRGASSDDASSWPQVIGRLVCARIISLNAISWVGFRTPKIAETPMAETLAVPLEYGSPSSVEIKGGGLVTGRIVTAIEQTGDGHHERSV